MQENPGENFPKFPGRKLPDVFPEFPEIREFPEIWEIHRVDLMNMPRLHNIKITILDLQSYF